MRYSLKKLFVVLSLISLMAFAAPQKTLAQEAIKGRYFNTYVQSGIDKVGLLEKLNAGYFLQRARALSDTDYRKGDSLDDQIAKTLDAIYLEVSDILDIHMYSFSIDLEILPGRDTLSEELVKYFNKRLDMPSFYFYDRNKIYISYADMTLGMLSHEIAHAIVSHYFVVPPPVKVQEILAGYAEYSIRKSTVNPSKK